MLNSMHPDDREFVKKEYGKLRKGKIPPPKEFRIKSKKMKFVTYYQP